MDTADAVIDQYSTAQAGLRANLLAMLARLWSGLTSYGADDAQRFAAEAVPLVSGAQRATAALTVAYLGRVQSELTGAPVQMAAVSPSQFVGDAVRNADPYVVYGRPFREVQRILADGKPPEVAVAAGARRLQSIAATDVQLAKTHASQAAMSAMDGVDGYRRVLEGAYNCGLCIIASTQRYHKKALMEIHPGCDCGVAPLLPGEAIGQVIEPGRLAAAHAAIADRFGKSSAAARGIAGEIGPKGKPLLYQDVLISHQHGEIGPVLGVRGQNFTGPADIPTP